MSQEIKNQNLLAAVKNGNLKETKKALEQGADINVLDEKVGKTPLMLAMDNVWRTHGSSISYIHYMATINFLIKHSEIDLNKQSSKGYTAIMIAVVHELYDVVVVLLKKNVDLTLGTNSGQTVLDIATKESDLLCSTKNEKSFKSMAKLISLRIKLDQDILEGGSLSTSDREFEKLLSQSQPLTPYRHTKFRSDAPSTHQLSKKKFPSMTDLKQGTFFEGLFSLKKGKFSAMENLSGIPELEEIEEPTRFKTKSFSFFPNLSRSKS